MQDETETITCHKYCTGSRYYGKLDDEGNPTGYGRFRFPNGIEYQGEYKHGVFHGRGTLLHPTKFKMCGEFADGKCVSYRLYFADGLGYAEDNWKYCKRGDRRFWQEIVRGISPVGETFLTKDKPSRPVPLGMYDAEEGFFDPVTSCIYDVHTGAKRRYVCPHERRYILKNYRMNDDEFVERERRGVTSMDVDISTDSAISDDE